MANQEDVVALLLGQCAHAVFRAVGRVGRTRHVIVDADDEKELIEPHDTGQTAGDGSEVHAQVAVQIQTNDNVESLEPQR